MSFPTRSRPPAGQDPAPAPKTRGLSRRSLLAAAATSPLAAAIPIAGSQARPSVDFTCSPWPAGPVARPAYSLDLREAQMSLFGARVNALLAGGTWPGPALRFRKGELFRVQVNNRLRQPTAVHWHGLLLPNLQDGVPEVTQFPIPPGMAQYYEFQLKQAGSYWYHSHFGLQEQAGLSGPLVIEDPDEPHGYDSDEVLFLSDVPAQDVDTVIPLIRDGSMKAEFEDAYALPDGSGFEIDVRYGGYLLNGATPADPWRKTVRPGERLRLRLINGSGSSYFRVMVAGMPMTVIAADGQAVQPVEVDSLVLATGQRYDVLVTVPGSGRHAIHAAALGDNRQAVGLLETEDAGTTAAIGRPDFAGRTLDEGDLRAPGPTVLAGRGDPASFEVVLSGKMAGYQWFMNDKAWPEAFAPPDAARSFYDVVPGQVVRFKLVNKTMMAHPMHLHGHVFRVLGPDGTGPEDAILRDTVSVPPRATLWIEFLADNPGTWFWHCHNAWHLASGMAQAVRYRVPPEN